MKYMYVIMTAILVVLLGISTRHTHAQPCSGVIDNPHNRKLCTLIALYGNALDAYSEEMRSNQGYPIPARNRIDFLENLPFVDRGTKRQDVDHVFLRFGRRR